MKTLRKADGTPDFRQFENYGFYYGLLFGLLAGVSMAGPHFGEWSAMFSLGTMAGCGIVGGAVGHVAIAMVYGRAVSGFGDAADEPDAASDQSSGADNATSPD